MRPTTPVPQGKAHPIAPAGLLLDLMYLLLFSMNLTPHFFLCLGMSGGGDFLIIVDGVIQSILEFTETRKHRHGGSKQILRKDEGCWEQRSLGGRGDVASTERRRWGVPVAMIMITLHRLSLDNKSSWRILGTRHGNIWETGIETNGRIAASAGSKSTVDAEWHPGWSQMPVARG